MGFKKVEEVLAHVGGKVLIFGAQGSGKSTLSGSFPNINLVDSEDGQTYYLGKNPNIKAVIRTVSASEVQETFEELKDEDYLKEFDTLCIDSGTKLYENMQSAGFEVAEQRATRQFQKGKDIDLDDINLSQRDWGHIKRWNQQLATSYILFSSLGKWIVVTAHQKDVFREATKAEKAQGIDRVKIGEAPDLAKKAEYDYDIVIQTFTEEDPKTGETIYKCRILKDRTGATKKGQIIENPSFEIWRPVWEQTKKYGVKTGVDLAETAKKDFEVMQSEQETTDTLIATWKQLMKDLTEAKNMDAIGKVNKLLKQKEIDVKNLTSCSIEDLTELVDFTKLQA